VKPLEIPIRSRALLALFLVFGCVEPFTPRVGVPTLDDAGQDGFVAVSAGLEHTCALTADGFAYCWGSNEFGQLGVPLDTSRCQRDDRLIDCQRQPRAVTGSLRFQRISAGARHTCALALDSRIYCWGDNLRGALGDPTVRQSFVPGTIASSALFMDVAAGGLHSCGLRTDGAILCWGANEFLQLGTSGVGSGSAIPVATATLLRFASVSAGEQRTCARTADGASYCWGAMWVRSLAGEEFLRAQGTPDRVQPPDAFQFLSAGANTTCGITPNFTAFCWEANPAGGIGDGTTIGSADPVAVRSGRALVDISTGLLHTCAVADSGHAYCWGAGDLGQLGVSSATLSTRCDGALVPCTRLPVRASGWRVYGRISAGGNHTCALTLAGNVYCWGAGAMGQRGDGRSTLGEWSPVKTRSPSM
jgi:alpha-tubulin suppressor-like RCC1 family protein